MLHNGCIGTAGGLQQLIRMDRQDFLAPAARWEE